MSRIAQLEKLLALDANDTFVLYGLAQEHAKSGNHAAAVGWYDRCLAVDPAYCYAYFHKARSQQAMDDVAAAVGTLKAGQAASKKAGDGKALSEISGFLDELE